MEPIPKEGPIAISIAVFSVLCLFALVAHTNFPADLSPRRPFISKITAIPKRPPLLPPPWVQRTGIVDDFGVMAEEFLVGDYDPHFVQEWRDFAGPQRTTGGRVSTARVESYGACDESMRDYIPCMDSVEIRIGNFGVIGDQRYERHCPPEGEGLNCLVLPPKGYRAPIPWPQSRDQVWLSNLPNELQIEDKSGSNLTSVDGNMFIFPGGGEKTIHEADHHINQISKMVSEIEFGKHTRVVLDIGCGMASFGAFLSQHNVTTLSIAPKDVNQNSVQFALERGAPAMIAVFATHRLLYPSQGFDFIHCSGCRINWTRDDGALLLEANRMLRAGGYFAWSAQSSSKHEENSEEQWKEIQDLASRICWKLVKEEEEIVIWQKPLNNSCYHNRDYEMQPPICDSNDDPDDVWYVGLKACISMLPSDGYGNNVPSWPARLQHRPDRLQSIKVDTRVSTEDVFKAESNFWNEIIGGYVHAYHWKELKFRNVMDMRAGFGGFAAALLDFQIDCWVMNVVPVSGFNTLPVIYDRGLIGVVHDWCEPFDTYPRTYDLLHAAGLFSSEQKRCNVSTIMLEMDRILRPSGHVYIRDSVSIMGELNETAAAMGWVTALHETAEGPLGNWKVLVGEKRM